MDTYDLPGTPPVRLRINRSGRARRISLRVSRLDGQVTLTLPARTALRHATAFADARADWIRRQIAALPAAEAVTVGATLPVEGRCVTVARGARTALSDDVLTVSPRVRAVAPAVGALLKARARDRLAAASDRHAAALGRRYARITLRDTRSRWGSCSSAGALMYSWRLILAPPEVLDYVAAHEVAHLAEMNHSTRYWAVVARLCPGYAAPRDWLRRHGADLHRYRFDGG